MLPRFSADYRTLLWTLIAPALVATQYARPDLVPYLVGFSMYFALACGVIAHNHNHCATFPSKRANEVFGIWLSLFYGYPTFAWVPTHNLNHHKYVNAEGDATITWRFTNRHNFLVAFTYFFVSAYYQSEPINEFIAKAKRSNRPLYRRILTQYVVWGSFYVGMLALAVVLHGWGTGLYVWGLSLALPAFFALWTIMLFNYDQHVHTDSQHPYNHSRSFVSPALNFLLFNNGYHYAHHEQPGTHWTKLAAVHAEFEDRIDPVLVQRSLWWYWFKQYALSPIVPSLGTKQMGPDPRALAATEQPAAAE